MHKFIVSSGPHLCKSFMASNHVTARRLFVAWARSQVAPCDLDKVAVVDCEIAGYCHLDAATRYNIEEDQRIDTLLANAGIDGICESVWARLPQEELDKVHSIWCRKAGDAKCGN